MIDQLASVGLEFGEATISRIFTILRAITVSWLGNRTDMPHPRPSRLTRLLLLGMSLARTAAFYADCAGTSHRQPRCGRLAPYTKATRRFGLGAWELS